MKEERTRRREKTKIKKRAKRCEKTNICERNLERKQ
jgi:hypothetical protein